MEYFIGFLILLSIAIISRIDALKNKIEELEDHLLMLEARFSELNTFSMPQPL